MSKGISWYPMLADRTMLLGGVCPFARALISSRMICADCKIMAKFEVWFNLVNYELIKRH